MGKKSNIYDHGLLDHLRQLFITPPAHTIADQKQTMNVVGSHSGLYNTVVPEPRANFVVASNSMLLTDSTKNVGIVIGSDRPSTKASGYGGKGAQKANTIDLVVGRMSSQSRLPDGQIVNNAFSGDAARIYISQMTDIDINFGVEPGQSGNIKGRSGIGIKADAVRVIGREGVKIVTGRSFAFKGHGAHGEQNSRGGKIKQPAPPIELIAGNIKTESGILDRDPPIRVLQGIAKGEHVRDAFRDLGNIVEELNSAVFALALVNTTAFTALALTPIPHHAAAGAAAAASIGAWILPSLHMTRVTKTLWDVNYAQPIGDYYVVSTNVFAT
jgi:hypothetical protein|tara:strand:- start:2847 stop:3830 length:984 start_codon:yes stop_codon:yes gene_type:complete